MKKETKKDFKFIISFIIIVVISFAYLFQASLAKYRKQANAEVKVNIAKWNIVVNNEDISNKSKLAANIIPTFEGNQYTNESVIAPGSVGYYDINIDATNVDVDFTYSLTSSLPEESSISDLKLTGYIVNPSSTNTTIIPFSEASPISNDITRNTNNNIVRVYFEWYDEDDNNMNNTDDTSVAINDKSKALINVTIRFSQKKN